MWSHDALVSERLCPHFQSISHVNPKTLKKLLVSCSKMDRMLVVPGSSLFFRSSFPQMPRSAYLSTRGIWMSSAGPIDCVSSDTRSDKFRRGLSRNTDSNMVWEAIRADVLVKYFIGRDCHKLIQISLTT